MQIYELFKRKQNHKMNFIESAHKKHSEANFYYSASEPPSKIKRQL